MKKLILFTATFLVLLSCKKEETNSTPTWPDYIVGTWGLDDLEMQIKLKFNGLPIEVEGESIDTDGGYTFNNDNSFSYDWSADVAIDLAPLFSDTIPLEQQGNGTYKVLGEDQIELTENGQTSVLDIVSKSPTLVVVQLEQEMDVDSLGTVDVEIESILSK
ncbi:MAG: hypothetical protein N4A46_08605 [Schleiferiaceae bacterium]|jgi:hypothetical protein|nr:hypothetical protein [Schleiferiaceae bacterium]